MGDEKRFELMSKEVEGKTVYNMGCVGDLDKSELQTYLSEKHQDKQIIGVDIKPQAEVRHDLNKPFPKKWKKADTIVAGELVEHLLNPYSFLVECHKLLKPRGKLIISTPNAIGLNKIFIPEKKLCLDHIYCWRKAQLKRLVKLAGFSVEREYLLNFWRKRWFIFKLIATIFPKYNGVIMIICRKK